MKKDGGGGGGLKVKKSFVGRYAKLFRIFLKLKLQSQEGTWQQ